MRSVVRASEPRVDRAMGSRFVFRVVGQLEAFDRCGALVADVADDVGDGVGLVAEVAVGDVGDREAGAGFGAGEGGEEAGFHFWSDFLVCGRGRGGAVGAVCLVDGRKAFSASCRAFEGRVFEIFGEVFVALANVGVELGGLVEGAHNVLHVVSLAVDEGAEVEDDALGFVALTDNGDVGVLEGGELLLVALALALELFGNLLLEDQSFQGVVALLFRTGETHREAGSVVFLLLDERRQAAVFAFVVFDLDFEVLGLFGELFGERLEFEELENLLAKRPRNEYMRILRPAVSNSQARPPGSCSSWSPWKARHPFCP